MSHLLNTRSTLVAPIPTFTSLLRLSLFVSFLFPASLEGIFRVTDPIPGLLR